MESFTVGHLVLIFYTLIGNIDLSSEARRFVKMANIGFREKEGMDTPVESLIECAAMCNTQSRSSFYFKKTENGCNQHTNYAVSPIADQQYDWSFYEQPVKGPNIAVNMKATQSSHFQYPYSEHGSHLAVDGNIPNNFGGYNCTHTNLEHQPWLKIGLGNTKRIDRVVMYNRQDDQGQRLQYLRIDVTKNSNPSLCGYFNFQSKTAETVTVMCTTKPEGSEIKITITSENYLSLCEVEVYEWI